MPARTPLSARSIPQTRRRFLGGTATLAAGAGGLMFAGCGDDDSPGATPSAVASVTSAPAAGGTIRYPLAGFTSGDPTTLDPFESLSYLTQRPASIHYSRLLRGEAAPGMETTAYGELEGDMAIAMPEQPDPTTYVFTLKPNIAFHDLAPMNGRIATAQDFAATYQAFLERSPNAGRFRSVVSSVEATDDTTIVVRLTQPFAPFLVSHAASDQGVFFVPVETLASGQAKEQPVGTGPWQFSRWDRGVALRWQRHPKYHDAPLPYFDGVEASLLGDPQRILAGLKAGELDFSQLDAAKYTQAHDELDPAGTEWFAPRTSGFGFFFNFDIAPWQDKRVRQALSMALDREGYLGIQDQTGRGNWDSFIGPALTPYYLSPRDDAGKFGPNAARFQKNIAEAKKLLAAAGYPDGFDFQIVSNVDRYGEALKQTWELVASTIPEAGFRAELVYQEYGAYIGSTFLGNVPPNSVGLGPITGTVLDPDDIFFTCYHSASPRSNWGGTAIPEQADLDARFEAQRGILEAEERVDAIHEIQRVMAESFLTVLMHSAPWCGYAQPWVRDFAWKETFAVHSETVAKAWFDEERRAKG